MRFLFFLAFCFLCSLFFFFWGGAAFIYFFLCKMRKISRFGIFWRRKIDGRKSFATFYD